MFIRSSCVCYEMTRIKIIYVLLRSVVIDEKIAVGEGKRVHFFNLFLHISPFVSSPRYFFVLQGPYLPLLYYF